MLCCAGRCNLCDRFFSDHAYIYLCRFANIPSGTKLQLRTGHERVLGIQEASAAQPSSKAEGKRPRDLDMLPNQGTAAPPYSAATPNTSGTAATASKADQCGPAPSGAQAEKDRRALHVFTKQAEAELDAR